MVDPAPLLPEGLPTWIPFPDLSNGSMSSIPEIGYGDDGYGDNGYDTPTLTFPTAPQPNWGIYLIK